jgi:beta-phosphoglucomutase-like phosphatase (HAD superfamily)
MKSIFRKDNQMKLRIGQSLFDAVIFDFNGVLLLDTPWHEAAWQKTFEAMSFKGWNSSEMAWFVHGRTNRDIFSTVLNRDLEPGELEKLTELKESAYREICLQQGADFKLSPGVPTLLSLLAENEIPFAIATSSGEKNVRFYYQHLWLEKWFEWKSIIFDDGTIRGKPAPDIYLKAAANLETDPKKCVVLEDTISGLQAAKNAKIGMIIAVGDTWKPAREHGTDLCNAKLKQAGDLAGLMTLEDSAGGRMFYRDF